MELVAVGDNVGFLLVPVDFGLILNWVVGGAGVMVFFIHTSPFVIPMVVVVTLRRTI